MAGSMSKITISEKICDLSNPNGLVEITDIIKLI